MRLTTDRFGVLTQRVDAITEDHAPVTADIDEALCAFFGLSKGYWLRAQANHERNR